MPAGRPDLIAAATPDIIELALKYKGDFQSHLHILAAVEGILSEEHRSGIIQECEAWLADMGGRRSFGAFRADELEYLIQWAEGNGATSRPFANEWRAQSWR